MCWGNTELCIHHACARSVRLVLGGLSRSEPLCVSHSNKLTIYDGALMPRRNDAVGLRTGTDSVVHPSAHCQWAVLCYPWPSRDSAADGLTTNRKPGSKEGEGAPQARRSRLHHRFSFRWTAYARESSAAADLDDICSITSTRTCHQGWSRYRYCTYYLNWLTGLATTAEAVTI